MYLFSRGKTAHVPTGFLCALRKSTLLYLALNSLAKPRCIEKSPDTAWPSEIWWGQLNRSPWSIFNINQTNPKAIFLVRLRCSNRKLTRKLFHNRQIKLSGYSTTGRIKPSCYSSLLFRRLFHSALNLKVAIQRMGNGNTVLHTIPQQPQKQLLSRQVPLLKREDDERVWLMWNN